jgi:phosphate transport system permease protein
VGATLLALVISLPASVYLHIYAGKKSKFAAVVRFCFDVLWGVPSIVFGAFGFILMLFIGLKVSLLAGMVVVALLIMPIMARFMDEIFRTVPKELKETTYSLGFTKLETAYVLLRQTLPALITAILISLGRAIGDAAAVMFTAGYTDNIPTSLFKPAATLPLAIFFQLSSPIAEVRARAYAAALILTILILGISIATRYFTKKYTKSIIR